MIEDVRAYIQGCEACQKVNPASLKVVPELKSVEVPKQVLHIFTYANKLTFRF
jgi:hypothetical protein